MVENRGLGDEREEDATEKSNSRKHDHSITDPFRDHSNNWPGYNPAYIEH